MDQILQVYGLSKETLSTMFDINMKAMVCSPNTDTHSFDIITAVLQGDTLAPYLFIFGAYITYYKWQQT